MATSVVMTDKQKVKAGITLLDQDGQPFAVKPADVEVIFTSSDPTVAAWVPDADGLNGTITSGAVGSATISAAAGLADGSTLTDMIDVQVVNSAPGALSFTVGTPVEE